MTIPSQIPLEKLQKHLNRGLFSDHYLDDVVPTLDLWQSNELHLKVANVHDELKALLDSLQPEALDEAQLEELWVKPVLQKLGHHWSVQVKIRYRERGYRKPDYVFSETENAAHALTNQIYDPPQLAHALAVGDAKKWGVNLDRASANEERNPSQQIDEYLRYSELSWGILTDGRYWRLYERESSKNNDYYAVDLPALLRSEHVLDFYYFYLFFRREAFGKGEWLDQVLQGSITYAEQISDKLEDQVYEALELIAQGFLDYRRNRLTPDPTMLTTIYEQSLVLLYRLLFILYAESRQVLPMLDNELYAKELSLLSIRKEVQQQRHFGDIKIQRAVDRTNFYTRLNDLFFIIDQGDTRYNVSAYNGRLFSQVEYPFLYEKTVGDAYLAPAIDKLSRVYDAKKKEWVFVDYRDLDVRHLGAIYEKLLEYQLDIATEPLAVKEGKLVPAQAGEVEIEAGAVYLKTGNNERKITGSYYTPDYIVNFIVRQTLEPLLLEIAHQYADLDAEGHWQTHDRNGLRRAVLNLNVLDPATGSGHFMVEAVAFIARWLTELNLQPADIEAGEDELTYWKRQVVNACIYGIDVNRLAVELARLSLWLATVARGKPLSFLDHHVKHGNALVGARASEIGAQLNGVAEVGQQPVADGQLPLFDQAAFAAILSDAVGRMTAIEQTIAAAVGDVKGQEQSYALLDAELRRWRTLADVWTARHFGLKVTGDQWKALYDTIVGANNGARLPADLQAIVDEAERLSQQYRFLHPDLAFPEVFFGADGKPRPDAGFDAIIGNPPYVRQERIQPLKPYFATHYEVYSGNADIYVYFYERALSLLRSGGQMAYITANKWLRAGYGEPMRAFLASHASAREIVDFGHAPIFKDADTFPAIAVFGKSEPTPEATTRITQFPRTSLHRVTLNEYANAQGYHVPVNRFGAGAWSLENPEAEALMEKIRRAGVPLKEFAGITPYYGIKTGFNEAFLIDTPTKDRLVREDAKCAEIIKPYLRGQDIKRWSPEWAGLWMILLKSSENQQWAWSDAGENAEQVFAESYPSLCRYMKAYEDRLRQREDQGRYWWELRSCVYYDVFERPKIPIQRIAFHARFAHDANGMYINDAAIMLPADDSWLLSCLNSPANWYYAFRTLPHKKDEALAMDIAQVETLPIAHPTDETRAEAENAVRRLIALTNERRAKLHELLDWLRVEFEVEKAGQALGAFAQLDEQTFIDEVKKRRPNSAARLSPAALHSLKETYSQYAAEIGALDGETTTLEWRLSDLVNAAYGLTPADIELMWRTAPPRMPITPHSTTI